MNVSRRTLLKGAGLSMSVAPITMSATAEGEPFAFEGTYLDAAFTHPLGRFAQEATLRYAQERRADPQGIGPRSNPRNDAAARFARLVGADPAEIAIVPSTLEAENSVLAALGIGAGRGVVTDALHYDGALALYHHLARQGCPVSVVRPRENRVMLDDMRAAITNETRLIAISLVSSTTGFQHDLSALCAMAHEKGVLVYADAIQAAGAVPLDVKASGVDFVGCGAYKWLMGEFGCAFLYVRPDRLEQLRRVQVGWRQIAQHDSHALPFETPGPAIGDFVLRDDSVGLFEVSTPSWGALAVAISGLDYILGLGVESIARHRAPLVERLRQRLPAIGFQSLTPEDSAGPVIGFALQNAKARLDPFLLQSRIRISTYDHRIRVSPSVYNTIDDIDHLSDVLAQAVRR